ncbi:MAG TPA: hypothetical protein VJR22_02710 [Candidatus Nitrosotalea sp.]|nr:hypothetical protein [Nitrososphaerota archaeon]HKU32742.1 hypothetical protein [Candidatus Nitrosotalea sp.]
MEKFSSGFYTKTEEFLSKASILSYYIATYNAVNDQLGFENEPVTVDEIFDFINDLKHEGNAIDMPNITKTDISLTFSLLLKAGVGKPTTSGLAMLSN